MKIGSGIRLAALTVVFWGVAAQARENPPVADRTLTVLVADYAGLSGSSLAAIEALTATLLSLAGILMRSGACCSAGTTRPRIMRAGETEYRAIAQRWLGFNKAERDTLCGRQFPRRPSVQGAMK